MARQRQRQKRKHPQPAGNHPKMDSQLMATAIPCHAWIARRATGSAATVSAAAAADSSPPRQTPRRQDAFLQTDSAATAMQILRAGKAIGQQQAAHATPMRTLSRAAMKAPCSRPTGTNSNRRATRAVADSLIRCAPVWTGSAVATAIPLPVPASSDAAPEAGTANRA